MLKELREVILRSDAITVAGGLIMAFATFYLVEAVVVDLIAPLISVFIGDPVFEANSFSIGGSEFGYGAVIEAAITFALSAAVVYFALVLYRRHLPDADIAANMRACPECTTPISVVAKRCPHCTAVVPSGSA